MTYTIKETFPEPVPTGLKLEVDGEVIAYAKPVTQSTSWRVSFVDEYSLATDCMSEAYARRILEWLGEKMSPARVSTVLFGPDELHLAKVGQVFNYQRESGTRYRLRSDGAWEWQDSQDRWDTCLGGRPVPGAYPLVAE